VSNERSAKGKSQRRLETGDQAGILSTCRSELGEGRTKKEKSPERSKNTILLKRDDDEERAPAGVSATGIITTFKDFKREYQEKRPLRAPQGSNAIL